MSVNILGFIGGGQMTTAIARGLIRAKLRQPGEIIVTDINKKQLEPFEQLGCQIANDAVEIAMKARVLILAVKPDVIPKVVTAIASKITSESLIISIAAGITIASIERDLPPMSRVIRVMPNTPSLVNECAAAIALGKAAKPADEQLVLSLFNAIGKAYTVDEKMLDAVTGVSGSGPAYVFLFIEALADGGVRAGLPRATALALAAQTVKGAASMVLETNVHPGELKDRVASPGGTTIAAVHALERGGFRGTVMNAVMEANNRAKELGMQPKL